MARLKTQIKQAMKPVSPYDLRKTQGHTKDGEGVGSRRRIPLPEPQYEEIGELTPEEQEKGTRRKATKFVTFEVTGSTGKKYRVTCPEVYYKKVPKVWEWTPIRYKVAELIADGHSIRSIADDPEVGVARMTIYAWLEHPEFREHVDALVTETGFASRRERLAGLARLTQRLFDKLLREIDGVPITDKSVGAIISGIQQGMKQLATEKGEFVEQQNVTQQTTIGGQLAVADVKVDELLKSATDEERKKLEEEFDRIGDEIIRGLLSGSNRAGGTAESEG